MAPAGRIDTPGGDLRARVLRAAGELFVAQGYYTTTTREIARRAGTSESGILRVFSGKYELFIEVFNAAWLGVNQRLDARLTDARPTLRDPREEILTIFAVFGELYHDDPRSLDLILLNSGNADTLLMSRRDRPLLSEENMRFVYRLDALCRACVEGGWTPPYLTQPALREALLGILEGVLLGWYLSDRRHTTPAYDLPVPPLRDVLTLLAALLYGDPALAGSGPATTPANGRKGSARKVKQRETA